MMRRSVLLSLNLSKTLDPHDQLATARPSVGISQIMGTGYGTLEQEAAQGSLLQRSSTWISPQKRSTSIRRQRNQGLVRGPGLYASCVLLVCIGRCSLCAALDAVGSSCRPPPQHVYCCSQPHGRIESILSWSLFLLTKTSKESAYSSHYLNHSTTNLEQGTK